MNAHDIRAWERVGYNTDASKRIRERLRRRVWSDSFDRVARDGVLVIGGGVVGGLVALAGAALLKGSGWL